MTINLKKDFIQLNEIIRKINNTLSPYNNEDLSWLKNKELRSILYGKKPKCFLQLKKKFGEPIPYFCICNRMGIHDPNAISFSMKLAKKLRNNEHYDQGEIEKIILKLKHLYNTYNKEIPKPPVEASMKGKQTRNFSTIKKYLAKLKS